MVRSMTGYGRARAGPARAGHHRGGRTRQQRAISTVRLPGAPRRMLSGGGRHQVAACRRQSPAARPTSVAHRRGRAGAARHRHLASTKSSARGYLAALTQPHGPALGLEGDDHRRRRLTPLPRRAARWPRAEMDRGTGLGRHRRRGRTRRSPPTAAMRERRGREAGRRTCWAGPTRSSRMVGAGGGAARRRRSRSTARQLEGKMCELLQSTAPSTSRAC